jgi:urease accessory protein
VAKSLSKILAPKDRLSRIGQGKSTASAAPEIVMRISAFVAAFLSVAGPALAHHVMDSKMPVSFMDGLLSGLGHPIIGLDHLAAVIAVGCLAAGQRQGALAVIGYVVAMAIGAAAHIGEATVAGAEIFVALSVIALGLVLLRARPLRLDIAIALFAFAGLVHGYALGESIAGAQPAPLYAYFIGLALIQSAIALATMQVARMLAARAALEPTLSRLLGAAVTAVGLSVFVLQFVSGA